MPEFTLDYAATTPVDPAVVRVMKRFFTTAGAFGNPASMHRFGRAAGEAVESARREVADLMCSHPDEIVWTSGATEAINLALKGAALARRDRGRHIVTSPLEHRAVLDTVGWLESRGFEISYVEPDDGEITPANLARVMRRDTIVVSLMLVNNETGTRTEIPLLAPIVHEAGALFHVDAVQGGGRVPMDLVTETADLISISGHKFYGPKGVGALRVRKSLLRELVPQMHGGGHELGLRAGTLPTHQIAGMGEAARLVRKRTHADRRHVIDLDRRFCAHLDRIPQTSTNGSPRHRVPGIINVCFEGVAAEALMIGLEDVAVATGSACTSADVRPSHVLLGIGLDEDAAFSSIRCSFGRFTTMDEIDRAGRALAQVVSVLRRL